MQTIITKNLPATDHKPARIKATTSNGRHSLTVSAYTLYDRREPGAPLENADAHGAVAQMLIEQKLRPHNDSWSGNWVSGSLNDSGTNLVWMCQPVSSVLCSMFTIKRRA